MIAACPVCEQSAATLVWETGAAPILQLLAAGEMARPEHFGRLTIVRCGACGHLYNQAFNEALSERMYGGDVLSNVPVHASMSRGLEEIANWIGVAAVAGKRVLEVGGGSGHLARILARTAAEVTVFEPSRGLRTESLPEQNVTVTRAMFSSARAGEPADLIMCRQVLEHVADPLALLREIRAALQADGGLYLEVPRSEYIEANASLFDLHYAHVQYFHEAHVLALAARAGFTLERRWHLKQGHDMGFLLRAAPAQAAHGIPAAVIAPALAERFDARRRDGRRVLAGLSGRIGLYGATWQGLSFLTTFDDDRAFAAVVDDNAGYDGFVLFSRRQRVPVVRPSLSELAELDAIIITAYLHEAAIRDTLQRIGYAGRLIRVEPACEMIAAPGFAAAR